METLDQEMEEEILVVVMTEILELVVVMVEILELEGFTPDMSDKGYCLQLQNSLKRRRRFISERYTVKDGYDMLPAEALEVVDELVSALHTYK